MGTEMNFCNYTASRSADHGHQPIKPLQSLLIIESVKKTNQNRLKQAQLMANNLKGAQQSKETGKSHHKAINVVRQSGGTQRKQTDTQKKTTAGH
jgi:hypothetical protein